MGRWSRPLTADFVRWLALPPGLRWTDVGCGTGSLTTAVLAAASPAEVVGVDSAEPFVELARESIDDPRARFELGDAAHLPLPGSSADAVVSALVLNFVPDAAAALAEFGRIATPGATIAACVWDYADGMRMLREFWDAAAVDPAAAALDEGVRFPICHPEPLHELWCSAGLADVLTEPLTVATVFAGFDDYWTPFLGGQGPAGGYVGSLSARKRDDLRDRLRAALPTQDDGSIALTARAWAVRGSVWD